MPQTLRSKEYRMTCVTDNPIVHEEWHCIGAKLTISIKTPEHIIIVHMVFGQKLKMLIIANNDSSESEAEWHKFQLYSSFQ